MREVTAEQARDILVEMFRGHFDEGTVTIDGTRVVARLRRGGWTGGCGVDVARIGSVVELEHECREAVRGALRLSRSAEDIAALQALAGEFKLGHHPGIERLAHLIGVEGREITISERDHKVFVGRNVDLGYPFYDWIRAWDLYVYHEGGFLAALHPAPSPPSSTAFFRGVIASPAFEPLHPTPL